MPSRSNRLRNRKALTGDESDDSTEEIKVPSKAPRARTARKGRAPPAEPPGRLRRLLSVLLATTLLLALYQGARLYVQSNTSARSASSTTTLGRGNVGQFVKSFWQQGRGGLIPPVPKQQQAVGGMVLHPTANDEQDAESPQVLSSDNADVRLEDLDMDTLQAAFDALYGDDGPLGPQRSKEDGSYRVVNQGRKEGLNE
ncbi:hypothetical protein BDZ90DRAFT_257219 [Jaminaea rosea]|uniref:Uncharacterized protein n=1 Tax=Jaminaea rosea TaxID=1569628 RepID=A0A316UY33_9BASI|nr:hypothetical protein BDZ90DRAFT_257219 [Jaminaea rosea]PWN30122.1 hypothetical protein BDZ90DRAFT_257219 [Jaminaea rosea]